MDYVWTFELDHQLHTLRFVRKPWPIPSEIWLDEKLVVQSQRRLWRSATCRVDVVGKSIILLQVERGLRSSCYLLVEGLPAPSQTDQAAGIDAAQLLEMDGLRDIAYWQQVAQRSGLQYIVRPNAPWPLRHALFGTITDRTLVVHLVIRRQDLKTALVTQVCHADEADPKVSTAQIRADPHLKSTLGYKVGIPRGTWGNAANSTWAILRYRPNREPAPTLATRLRAFTELVALHTAPRAESRCPHCAQPGPLELIFVNGAPLLWCTTCVEQLPRMGRDLRQQYQQTPSNWGLALLVGLGMGSLVGILTTLVTLLIPGFGFPVAVLMWAVLPNLAIGVSRKLRVKATVWNLLVTVITAGLGAITGMYSTLLGYRILLKGAALPGDLIASGLTFLRQRPILTLLFVYIAVFVVTALQVWLNDRGKLQRLFQPQVERLGIQK